MNLAVETLLLVLGVGFLVANLRILSGLASDSPGLTWEINWIPGRLSLRMQF